ncbi:MAG: hypothetical protein WED00_17530 [Aquisalimonadaceae bacterium]
MVENADSDNMRLMSPSDALELVLELAQGQAEQIQHRATVREAERLSVQAALEQLDHLLHEHWETLDGLSRDRTGREAAASAGAYVWWVRGSIPVEQSPSEAILLAIALAEKAHPLPNTSSQSVNEALSWTRQFVARYGVRLDRAFGRTEW